MQQHPVRIKRTCSIMRGRRAAAPGSVVCEAEMSEQHALHRGTTHWDCIDENCHNWGHGNVCKFPVCDALISNGARYCHEHGSAWRIFRTSVIQAAERERRLHPVRSSWRELSK